MKTLMESSILGKLGVNSPQAFAVTRLLNSTLCYYHRQVRSTCFAVIARGSQTLITCETAGLSCGLCKLISSIAASGDLPRLLLAGQGQASQSERLELEQLLSEMPSMQSQLRATAHLRAAILQRLQPVASGQGAISFGDGDTGSGVNSVTFGLGNANSSYSAIVGGRYATLSGSSTGSWVSTDPVFVLGNGTGSVSR